jgi:hypothetical protein
MTKVELNRGDEIQNDCLIDPCHFELLEPRVLFAVASPIIFEHGTVSIDATNLTSIQVVPYFGQSAPTLGMNSVGFFANLPGGGFGGNFLMSDVKKVVIDGHGAKSSLIIVRDADIMPLTFKLDLIGERANYLFFRATEAEYVSAMTKGIDIEKQLNGNADDLLEQSAVAAESDTPSSADPVAPESAAEQNSLPPVVQVFSTQPAVSADSSGDDAVWA